MRSRSPRAAGINSRPSRVAKICLGLNTEDGLLISSPSLRQIWIVSRSDGQKGFHRAQSLAHGTHILLLDDDIEIPPEYLESLVQFMLTNPSMGAVSGGLLEEENGQLLDSLKRHVSVPGLCWNMLFQLGTWVDIGEIKPPRGFRAVFKWVSQYYAGRVNTSTLAGWPLVTQMHGDSFRTKFFGLGAALIRRNWLLDSRYDEILGPHGIGDNYGVALHFPGPITVLRSVSAIHHRSSINRPPASVAYYRRVLALDYFIRISDEYAYWKSLMLFWSLLGNLPVQLIHLRMREALATVKALLVIGSGTNPYLAKRRRRDQEAVFSV